MSKREKAKGSDRVTSVANVESPGGGPPIGVPSPPEDSAIQAIKADIGAILALVSEKEFLMLQRYGADQVLDRVKEIRERLEKLAAAL